MIYVMIRMLERPWSKEATDEGGHSQRRPLSKEAAVKGGRCQRRLQSKEAMVKGGRGRLMDPKKGRTEGRSKQWKEAAVNQLAN